MAECDAPRGRTSEDVPFDEGVVGGGGEEAARAARPRDSAHALAVAKQLAREAQRVEIPHADAAVDTAAW